MGEGRANPAVLIQASSYLLLQAPELLLERVVGNSLPAGSGVAYAVDGSLAYAAGHLVVLQQAGAGPGEPARFLRHPAGSKSFRCLAFSEDGRLLAAGEDGRQTSVVIWDLSASDDDKPLVELRGHKYAVAALAICPNGKIITLTTGRAASGRTKADLGDLNGRLSKWSAAASSLEGQVQSLPQVD